MIPSMSWKVRIIYLLIMNIVSGKLCKIVIYRIRLLCLFVTIIIVVHMAPPLTKHDIFPLSLCETMMTAPLCPGFSGPRRNVYCIYMVIIACSHYIYLLQL